MANILLISLNTILVILNSQNPAIGLFKEYTYISFHVMKEFIAVGIIDPYWFKGLCDTLYLITKKIHSTHFKNIFDYI